MVAALALAVCMLQAPDSDKILSKIVAQLDCSQVDVRSVLQNLMRDADLSFDLPSDIQGTVTVNLKKIPLRRVLRNVLAQVDASYEIRDAACLFFRWQNGPSGRVLKDFRLADVEAKQAVAAVFDSFPAQFKLDPKVRGRVTVADLPPEAPFESALRAVLDKLKADYEVKGATYLVYRIPEPAKKER